jgi:hypothetical protein
LSKCVGGVTTSYVKTDEILLSHTFTRELSMNKYEQFALDHYLSSYPKEMTFDQVIDLLEYLDERVLVWEPFDTHHQDDVTEYIKDMVTNLESAFPAN